MTTSVHKAQREATYSMMIPSPSFSMLFSALALFSWSTMAVAQTPLALGNLKWSEEFNYNGAPKSDFWKYDTGNGNGGWGNLEVQEYTSSSNNIQVQGGRARIKVQKSGNQFTSARILTHDKVEFKYGSVEVRIKLPSLANGLWPAFWLLGSNFFDANVGWPKCGEIDILEAGAKDSISSGTVHQVVSSAAHWDVDGNYAGYPLALDTGSSFVNKWQVFRMDWTENLITTFVNGRLIWAFDIGSCRDTHCGEFHQPYFFVANLAVGGRFTGILDANQVTASTPATMEIDYIRIYDNSAVNAQVTVGGIQQAPPNSTPSPIQSTPAPTPAPVITKNRYDIDCGVPTTCTDTVLSRDAGGATCYDHIKWLMDVRGRDELYACDSTARKEFPAECGGCDPGTGQPFIDYAFDCGAPQLCNDNVLNQDAPAPGSSLGPTCGERISHLMEVDGWTEQAACAEVAGVEYPFECGECVHGVITCGFSGDSECANVLDEVSNDHTCRARISYSVYAFSMTELEACAFVANEPANIGVCGPCDPF